MSVHVVIMAGGIGSRFWPLSTPERPKQFIDVLGVGRSLLQLTRERFCGIAEPENLWVVTNAGYVDKVREHLPEIPAGNIIAETVSRNTAPCIALACWSILRKDPEANIVFTPSDAYVRDVEEFRRVVKTALDFSAGSGSIVTIGIRPNRPETGYGYVQLSDEAVPETAATLKTAATPKAATPETAAAEPQTSNPNPENPNPAATPTTLVRKVAQFREKPDLETAKSYLAAGNFLWNAGIFVGRLSTLVDAFRTYDPQIAANMDTMLRTGDLGAALESCRKISMDYAVMEPASADGLVYTVPAEFGWSDLGNWQSLYERLDKDADGNAVVGRITLSGCHDCIVHAEDSEELVLEGLEGYIVAAKDGKILVCRRSEEQRINNLKK